MVFTLLAVVVVLSTNAWAYGPCPVPLPDAQDLRFIYTSVGNVVAILPSSLDPKVGYVVELNETYNGYLRVYATQSNLFNTPPGDVTLCAVILFGSQTTSPLNSTSSISLDLWGQVTNVGGGPVGVSQRVVLWNFGFSKVNAALIQLFTNNY